MQCYLGIQVAELLNLNRETVSIYVQKFNQGGMDALLERRYAPGRKPYLSPEEERELKKMLEESTPADEGYGIETGWNTRIIQHVLEEKFSVTMSRGGMICFIDGNFAIHALRIPSNGPIHKKHP